MSQSALDTHLTFGQVYDEDDEGRLADRAPTVRLSAAAGSSYVTSLRSFFACVQRWRSLKS